MSTDRELLEFAAKSFGLKGWKWCKTFGGMKSPRKKTPYGYATSFWSPLRDDGDALKLAVKLRLHIQPSATTDDLSPSVEVYDSENMYGEVVEIRLDDDPYAATRRAIVCAAAEIEKAKSGD